ncbi:MAG: hypothetical protein AB7O96_08635 [Pseudobdellovibrionaceae bacterium]
MKTILFSLALVLSSSAFAETNCSIKQSNAASYELAQKIGVPVQNVEVIGYEPGPWTEAMGENTGSDKITVRVGNRENRGLTVVTYTVVAKQIGSTDDCRIIDVVVE